MKQFGSTLAFFLPFSLMVYSILLCLGADVLPSSWTPNLSYKVGYAGHSFSRFEEAKKIEHVDMLFVGSSHAYRGFDPRIFKQYRTFNIGSSSQTPIQSEMLLSRYLDRLAPKVVIYEVYPLTFSMDGVESASDLIANDKNDVNSIKMALKTNKIKVYNTLIYGFYNDFLGRYDGYHEERRKYTDTYIAGGFVEREITHYAVPKNLQKARYELLDYQFEQFSATIQKLKSKGVKVVLVQTPIAPSEFKRYSNNKAFDERMRSYELPYYNFNELVHLDDSLHFYDKSHMNQLGVEIFNKKLLELLKNNDLVN